MVRLILRRETRDCCPRSQFFVGFLSNRTISLFDILIILEKFWSGEGLEGFTKNYIFRRRFSEFDSSPSSFVEYAQVTRMLGNGRLEAQCFDGKKRLAHIRGKMRKRVWVNAVRLVLCLLAAIDRAWAPR